MEGLGEIFDWVVKDKGVGIKRGEENKSFPNFFFFL